MLWGLDMGLVCCGEKGKGRGHVRSSSSVSSAFILVFLLFTLDVSPFPPPSSSSSSTSSVSPPPPTANVAPVGAPNNSIHPSLLTPNFSEILFPGKSESTSAGFTLYRTNASMADWYDPREKSWTALRILRCVSRFGVS